MLSFASKRMSTPISRHHQRFRRAAEIAARLSARQQQQQQRARLATMAASSTTKQQQPIVISRRAWLDFKASRGITKKRPDPSKRPKSDDEKPWPRNVQIAGYVAGALAVPSIILWTITSNPTLREWFGPYIPLDKLRPYYGKLEWDAQNYSEEMEGVKNKEKNVNNESQLIGYYQFPEEDPFNMRREQELIESMSETDVSVTLSLHSSSSPPSPAEEIVTKSIAAKTVANAKNLLEYFPSAMTSMNGNATVAVDFLDQENEDSDTSSFNAKTGNTDDPIGGIDGTLMADAVSMESDKIGGQFERLHNLTKGSQQLSKDIQTTSKWTYVPQTSTEGSTTKDTDKSSSNPQISKTEIEIGRLNYEISELEKNLRDPMCTRSIDDMTTELRQAKRELSRLTWKKRFGFGR